MFMTTIDELLKRSKMTPIKVHSNDALSVFKLIGSKEFGSILRNNDIIYVNQKDLEMITKWLWDDYRYKVEVLADYIE